LKQKSKVLFHKNNKQSSASRTYIDIGQITIDLTEFLKSRCSEHNQSQINRKDITTDNRILALR